MHALRFRRFIHLLDFARIVVKETNLSYHLEKVFDVDIPALHHGNDGLIYTRVSTPYTPGTDRNMFVHSLTYLSDPPCLFS